MDALQERLAELADDAPTGGAPAAELWARGKRAHRVRAAALAATLLVVGVVGTGIGVRLADGDARRSDPQPARSMGVTLPIDYPVGEDLPELGDTPGPLAAIWLAPRAGGTTIDVVGLVAETGKFGTLPIEVPDIPDDPENPVTAPWAAIELSPDGRRVAYSLEPEEPLVVRDLVSGEEQGSAFEFGIRTLDGWVDDTHVFGRVGDGSDGDGWVWEPGGTPRLVDFYSVSYGESGLAVPVNGGGPRSCSSPTLQDVDVRQESGGGWAGAFEVPVLCNVLGITDTGLVLGHWKDRQSGNGTVVALDVKAADPAIGELSPARPSAAEFEDPALRQVVAVPGGPDRVGFATELIARALASAGGAS
jgi:hypothetical protein